MDKIVPFRNVCPICKKKEATKLCDYVIDYLQPHFYRSRLDSRNSLKYETCDLPMCEECAVNHLAYDFCPHHNKLFQQVDLTTDLLIQAQSHEKMNKYKEIYEGKGS